MKLLLLDIETAPNKVYSWGLYNQNIAINQIDEPGYTLCWAAKWLGSDEVFFSSVQHDGAEAMLKSIYMLLDQADVVIHYNGSRFDIPVLNQEFLSAGFKPPAPFQEIDLYRTVKRRFKFVSNKLDYVLRHLGFEGKVVHKGMQLWLDCMKGDERAWKVMREYNIGDVVQLEKLYEHLKPWVPNHPNHGLYDPAGAPACPSCGSTHLQRRGLRYTATQAYQRFQCQDCGAWSRTRTTVVDAKDRPNVLKGE